MTSELNDPMDIYTKSGTSVIFHCEGGYNHEKDYAKNKLELGKKYTVLTTNVQDWVSYVTLQEFPDLEFNTVMFREASSEE